MKICIDTNIYSLFKKNDSFTVDMLENADEILVPAVVIGELLGGFYSGSRTEKNIKELKLFLKQPGISVVDIDMEIADRYGELFKILKKRGKPIPTNDLWIAATVLQTGAKLASLDSHFKELPGIFNIMENRDI